MSRLIRNGCNITGQKMTWSVKCVLVCKNFKSPIRSIDRLDLKIFDSNLACFKQISHFIYEYCKEFQL